MFTKIQVFNSTDKKPAEQDASPLVLTFKTFVSNLIIAITTELFIQKCNLLVA